MKRQFSNSQKLYDRATTLIPGGVNSPVRAFKQVGGTPVYFKSAHGSWFMDVDDNHYIDFCQSWGPLILGHAREEVIEAVHKAALDGLSFGACHSNEVKLAEVILGAFPEYDRIRFVNSGTEAVMTALRIARGATKRDMILKFEGGYHGHFDGMLVKAGSGLATQAIASSKGVPEPIAATTLVAPFDDEDAVASLFASYGERIAAIIIEPLPANNGLLVQRQGFLRFLREIASNHGALLIFDEVISGFRVGYGGYGQQIGVSPDIVTLGKIIGGGLPVGAIMGRAAELDLLSPLGAVYQAGTLSGNPISLAAGLATLEVLKHESPYESLDQMATMFIERLGMNGVPYARACHVGSIIWLYFCESEFPRRADRISEKAMQRFTGMYWNLLEKGFYLPPSSYEVLFLSAAHSISEVIGLATAINEQFNVE